MDNRMNKMSLDQIKALDMVEYLAQLGFRPEKIRGNDHWYISPLRDEKTPSFKIDRAKNRWYDHGDGNGGNLVDFGIRFHRITVGEFCKMMNGGAVIVPQWIAPAPEKKDMNSRVVIDDVRPIVNTALLRYLQQRRIDLEVADKFCKEVHYKIGDQSYFSIGLQNDAGGWALRNPGMKSASYPNGSTSIKNGSSTVVIIEGNFDFLSYQTIFKNKPESRYDFQVLNSVNNIQSTLPKLQGYQEGIVLADNDTAGQNVTEIILSKYPHFKDARVMFAAHKDINDWHCNIGKSLKRRNGLHP